MTEQPRDAGEDAVVETAAPDALRTGHPAVDEVLAGLDELDDGAVGSHVAVFERAHERLRAALDRPQP